jgi:hypothetical protein
MNCIRCNAPLPPDASFCRNCGTPVSINIPAAQLTQFQAPEPKQLPNYQPTVPVAPGAMQSTDFAGQRLQTFPSKQDMPAPPVRRRRGRGLIITLITLVALIIVLAGVWVLALRPYLHSLAQNQLDSTLTNAVNQINLPPLPQLPLGAPPPPPIRVTEDTINKVYLPLLHDPSSPVQNMHVQITSTEMRFDFTVYGFASDITGEPALVNGKLIATNVNVGGIVGLIMSSDEITALLNNHLADMQARLSRPITSVLLMNQEIDITLD